MDSRSFGITLFSRNFLQQLERNPSVFWAAGWSMDWIHWILLVASNLFLSLSFLRRYYWHLRLFAKDFLRHLLLSLPSNLQPAKWKGGASLSEAKTQFDCCLVIINIILWHAQGRDTYKSSTNRLIQNKYFKIWSCSALCSWVMQSAWQRSIWASRRLRKASFLSCLALSCRGIFVCLLRLFVADWFVCTLSFYAVLVWLYAVLRLKTLVEEGIFSQLPWVLDLCFLFMFVYLLHLFVGFVCFTLCLYVVLVWLYVVLCFVVVVDVESFKSLKETMIVLYHLPAGSLFFFCSCQSRNDSSLLKWYTLKALHVMCTWYDKSQDKSFTNLCCDFPNGLDHGTKKWGNPEFGEAQKWPTDANSDVLHQHLQHIPMFNPDVTTERINISHYSTSPSWSPSP